METVTAMSVLESAGLGGLSSVFRSMEIAEEEIEKAMKAHPWEADMIWSEGFRLCRIPEVISGKAEWLYRAHCVEICERIAMREKTEPGTRAEVVAMLCETSLVGPLVPSATKLYFRLWSELGGPDLEREASRAMEGLGAEDYEVEHVLFDMRKKLIRPWRKADNKRGKPTTRREGVERIIDFEEQGNGRR